MYRNKYYDFSWYKMTDEQLMQMRDEASTRGLKAAITRFINERNAPAKPRSPQKERASVVNFYVMQLRSIESQVQRVVKAIQDEARATNKITPNHLISVLRDHAAETAHVRSMLQTVYPRQPRVRKLSKKEAWKKEQEQKLSKPKDSPWYPTFTASSKT
ncbi:MAG: hypothetical protein AB7F19_07560 [Candidatus Babeliales bacterium]